MSPRGIGERLRGPWRVAVTEGSMLPSIEPGDWLLVNPLVRRWPPVGSVVLFREPLTDELAIKRVGAGPGERVQFAGGYLVLSPDEAWLEADATEQDTAAAGYGPPIDSARFGPVPLDRLVGQVIVRYGPRGRAGRIAPPPARTMAS